MTDIDSLIKSTKLCTKCKERKTLDSFGTYTRMFENGLGTRFNPRCKLCANKASKAYNKTRHGKAKRAKWRKKLMANPEHKKYFRKYYAENTGRIIYNNILYRTKGMTIISKEDFIKWHCETPKLCHYCGISEELALKADKGKKTRLQVDRKDNEKSYTLENIVFACAVCNKTKSNIFNEQEMLEIGRKYLKPKWKLNN